MKTLTRWLTVLATAFVALGNVNAIAGTVTYFHNDLLGSAVAATNASGQVVWRETYRPYGERLTNDSKAATNDVWYTSRRQDVDTGLVYMGARYYDPVVGRFMGVDANSFDPTSPATFNRYAYANNNPYKYVDPDGRASALATGLAIFVVATGTVVYITNQQARQAMDGSLSQLRRGLQNILNENSETAKNEPKVEAEPKTVDELRSGSKPENETSRGTKIWERDADRQGRDFDSLTGEADVRTLENGTRIATLPDGSRLVDRGSKDGRSTLEVQNSKGRTTDEFRYGPKPQQE